MKPHPLSKSRSRVAAFFYLDIVGLSRKTLGGTQAQAEKIRVLTELMSQCNAFKRTLERERLILPTGDGYAIDFGDDIEDPYDLAVQLHGKLESYNSKQKDSERIHVRIGLHVGTILELTDIKGHLNVWGQGIINARRVMDLGDENHILLTKGIADELKSINASYNRAIRKVGKFTIKHGERISVYSAVAEEYGNPNPPHGKDSELTLVNDYQKGIVAESFVTLWVDRDIKERELLEKLVRSVEETHRIDQSYLYWEASAAYRWRKVCEDPAYTLHQVSKSLVGRKIKDMIKTIVKDTNHRVFDFVNLGTGGGRKDNIIIESLLEAGRGKRMRYIPMDKSYSMLSDAIAWVLPLITERSARTNWEVIAILGDILKIERYKPIIYRGENPKLYGLLGSMIGNFDEIRVLSRIKSIMQDNDILMMGADLIGGRSDEELKIGYDTKSVRELMIYPIIEHIAARNPALVEAFKRVSVHSEIRSYGLRVPNSKRVQVFLLDDKTGNTYYHFFSTKYDLKSLSTFLKKNMGFRIIKTYTSTDDHTNKKRYVKFLLRKKP